MNSLLGRNKLYGLSYFVASLAHNVLSQERRQIREEIRSFNLGLHGFKSTLEESVERLSIDLGMGEGGDQKEDDKEIFH